jgi:hypothetical protein
MASTGNSSGIGEAAGLIVVAAVAMGLLAVGYNIRTPDGNIQATQAPSPATIATVNGKPSNANPATANSLNNNPSTALGATPQTQQRSPGNDTPSAPTSSTTGTGASNGSTGTPTQSR